MVNRQQQEEDREREARKLTKLLADNIQIVDLDNLVTDRKVEYAVHGDRSTVQMAFLGSYATVPERLVVMCRTDRSVSGRYGVRLFFSDRA